MRVKKVEEEPFEIPLIPMIDCMLVLIIYFLVSTTMKKMEKELPIQLPHSAASVEVEDTPELVVLGLDKQHNKYLNSKQITTEALHQELEKFGVAEKKPRVRIDADRDTVYSDIVELMEMCQFNGLRDVGLHMRRDDGK
jgi:biopolymer transport protein ExbD